MIRQLVFHIMEKRSLKMTKLVYDYIVDKGLEADLVEQPMPCGNPFHNHKINVVDIKTPESSKMYQLTVTPSLLGTKCLIQALRVSKLGAANAAADMEDLVHRIHLSLHEAEHATNLVKTRQLFATIEEDVVKNIEFEWIASRMA